MSHVLHQSQNLWHLEEWELQYIAWKQIMLVIKLINSRDIEVQMNVSYLIRY
jgi:hypothetical protein